MKIIIQGFDRDEASVKIETAKQVTWSVLPILFLRTLTGHDDIVTGDVFDVEVGTVIRRQSSEARYERRASLAAKREGLRVGIPKSFTRAPIPPVRREPDRKNDYKRQDKHKKPLTE